MICPNNGKKDFDLEDCIGCEYYSQCLSQSGLGNQGDNFPMTNKELPYWIIKGKYCKKPKKTICKLGYACDGCPYNQDNQKKDIDKIKKKNPITKEELDKFKIELGNIIYFGDWEKKLNE